MDSRDVFPELELNLANSVFAIDLAQHAGGIHGAMQVALTGSGLASLYTAASSIFISI